MVRVGIFGTSGELDRDVIEALIDEVLEQCCEQVGASEDCVEALVSHASGKGIAEYVFEEGVYRDLKTVGMVLPSCRAEEWFPVDEYVYVGGVWGEQAVTDCSEVVDIIVWVGDVEPKRDWIELANTSNVRMLSVSDSITDWISPSSVIDLGSVVDDLMPHQVGGPHRDEIELDAEEFTEVPKPKQEIRAQTDSFE